jgi:hypothetical protein
MSYRVKSLPRRIAGPIPGVRAVPGRSNVRAAQRLRFIQTIRDASYPFPAIAKPARDGRRFSLSSTKWRRGQGRGGAFDWSVLLSADSPLRPYQSGADIASPPPPSDGKESRGEVAPSLLSAGSMAHTPRATSSARALQTRHQTLSSPAQNPTASQTPPLPPLHARDPSRRPPTPPKAAHDTRCRSAPG